LTLPLRGIAHINVAKAPAHAGRLRADIVRQRRGIGRHLGSVPGGQRTAAGWPVDVTRRRPLPLLHGRAEDGNGGLAMRPQRLPNAEAVAELEVVQVVGPQTLQDRHEQVDEELDGGHRVQVLVGEGLVGLVGVVAAVVVLKKKNYFLFFLLSIFTYVTLRDTRHESLN